jgi:UDP:flavonoid glycosyltransferase YjiC (YdhE family)
MVLGNPAYRERAGRMQSSIEAADGLNRAAVLIEETFGTRLQLAHSTGR